MTLDELLAYVNKYVQDEDMPQLHAAIGEYHEALLNKLDPKCIKCGARRSDIELGRRSYNEEILCLPIDKKRAWLGRENHQYKPSNELRRKRVRK